MAKLKTFQSVLNAGELNPLLLGRLDVGRYKNGLEKCRNAIPLVTGGATRRPGSRFVNKAKGSGVAGSKVRFKALGITVAGMLKWYLVELTDQVLRFYVDGDLITTDGTTPYEVESPYAGDDLAAIKMEVREGELYLFHGDYQPRKLSRTADTDWTLGLVNFQKIPYFRPKNTADLTITPTTISGDVDLTASDDLFVSGMVGARFNINNGIVIIESVTSATEASGTFEKRIDVPNQTTRITNTVTVDIDPTDMVGDQSVVLTFTTARTDADSGELELTTSVIIPETLPAGVSATLTQVQETASSLEAYIDTITISVDPTAMSGAESVEIVCYGQMRNYDETITVRSYEDEESFTFETKTFSTVAFNSSVVIANSDPDHATATAEKVSIRVTGLEPDYKWTVESWGTFYGWPKAVTFFQQSMYVAGTKSQPTVAWKSKTGEDNLLNFEVGTADDEGMALTIAQATTPINNLNADEFVLIFTESEEPALSSNSGGAITPTDFNIKIRTNYGSKLEAIPIRAGIDMFFVTASGRGLRCFQYNLEKDRFIAPDFGVYGAHLLDDGGGIAEIIYVREPVPSIWARCEDGTLLVFTYDPDQDVMAWSFSSFSGEVKAFEKIPSPATGKDQVWIAVERDAETFVEVLEWELNTDSAVTENDATGKITWGGFDHLEGYTVDVLADGLVAKQQVVSSGEITLDYAAKTIEVGLHYQTLIKDLPPYIEGGVGGSATCTNAMVLLHKSKGCKVNGEEIPFRRFGDNLLDQGLQEFTGWKKVTLATGWAKDGSTMQVEITQDQPLPLTVLAIAKEVAVNVG